MGPLRRRGQHLRWGAVDVERAGLNLRWGALDLERVLPLSVF
jgi:hypothetical protein